MILAIIIAFFSLIGLLIIHELGHFLIAKKFGVKVEEFGFGYPPRIFGKKIGDTVYSLNLLPLGAFVKVYGEDGGIEGPLSFTGKSLGQRALIVAGGVLAFWVVAILLVGITASIWGVPDIFFGNGLYSPFGEEKRDLWRSSIKITALAENYPAQNSGILVNDIILNLGSGSESFRPATMREMKNFIQQNRGGQISITVLRNRELRLFAVSINDEGKVGVALSKVYPWYFSGFAGTQLTGQMTLKMLKDFAFTLGKLLHGEKVEGADVRGPIGIGELIAKSYGLGTDLFLYFLSLISVALAICNLLPIPAVDGGRLLFLAIEGIRKRPMSPKVEQKVNAAFFTVLVVLMIAVTFRDIFRLIPPHIKQRFLGFNIF